MARKSSSSSSSLTTTGAAFFLGAAFAGALAGALVGTFVAAFLAAPAVVGLLSTSGVAAEDPESSLSKALSKVNCFAAAG